MGYVTFPCGYTLDADGGGINLVLRRRRHQCRAGDREHHSDPWLARSTRHGVTPHDRRPAASSKDVQSGTADACSYPYTLSMQTDYVKTSVMGVWILAVGVLGHVLGAMSFVGWTVLVAMALTPPVVMMRLWRAPVPSMAESSREALR